MTKKADEGLRSNVGRSLPAEKGSAFSVELAANVLVDQRFSLACVYQTIFRFQLDNFRNQKL